MWARVASRASATKTTSESRGHLKRKLVGLMLARLHGELEWFELGSHLSHTLVLAVICSCIACQQFITLHVRQPQPPWLPRRTGYTWRAELQRRHP